MRTPLLLLIPLITLAAGASGAPVSSDGFNNAKWGLGPDAVRQAIGASSWQADGNAAKEFPRELGITAFKSAGDIAGYKAVTTCYFWNNRFFQATVVFNFDDLKKYDFNYNVFRSVNQYYNAIRSKTLIFTGDIFDLLQKKYGSAKPYFKDLDPRNAFVELDKYLRRESWNLRYHPYDYYLHIMTRSYARWDFPKTRAIFSVAISAPDKRFDYTLSLSSLDLGPKINAAKDSLRMKGL
jgi:hypothetical protein